MGRVDTPITKTLTICLKFLVFLEKHFMTMGELSENLQYFLELQKQRSKKRMSLFNEYIYIFRPPYFQMSYLPHFLFVLNNLKNYGNAT